MAITPTVMIAASGMLNGEGVGTNSNTTDSVNKTLGDPLITAYLSVANNANVGSVDGLSATLSSLPDGIKNAQSVTSSIISQAGLMAPDIKTFITLQSGATAFGSAGLEYGAALSQFQGKSFGDLGIGVGSFTDVNSGGMTSLVPGMGALAAKAKSDAFGGLGASLDPAALAKGQAAMGSAAMADGLKSIGAGLKNFGTLFDFSKPQSLGYKGLVESLQKQGLAESVGINDGISNYGYDPTKLSIIPDSVLKSVLETVQGEDLAKIVSQTGVKQVGTFRTAADLIEPSRIMPAGATAALGLKPGDGIVGLKSVGNTLTNIGVPLDNVSAAKLLEGAQTKVGGYLSGLNSLVPASVVASISPMLGSGSSPFGTPTMSDMMGSLSGAHNKDLGAMNTQYNSISSSPAGKSLTVALQTMSTALTANVGTDSAYTALQSSVTSFNNQASSNSAMSGALSKISAAASSITDHLNKELSNFSLGGINLSSPPAAGLGSAIILAFASKLHGFGVDKLQLGQNDIFNGAATNGVTGDAIKASLLEGKTIAALSAVGKTPSSVSNQTAALAAANEANIDSYIEDYSTSYSDYLAVRTDMLNNPSTATINAFDTALSALTLAQNKMTDAAANASTASKDKVAQVLEKTSLNPPINSENVTSTLTFKGLPKQ